MEPESKEDSDNPSLTTLSYEQAVANVLNAPPTPEQQAKKAARKVRAQERKKQKKPRHGR